MMEPLLQVLPKLPQYLPVWDWGVQFSGEGECLLDYLFLMRLPINLFFWWGLGLSGIVIGALIRSGGKMSLSGLPCYSVGG